MATAAATSADLAPPAGAGRPTSTRSTPACAGSCNPHTYHVSITDDLFDLKQRLLADLTATGQGARSWPRFQTL